MIISDCKAFKDKIEEITESQAKGSDENKEAAEAADLIEKLCVEAKDKEAQPETKDKEEKPEAKDAPPSAEEKKEEDKKEEKSVDKK